MAHSPSDDLRREMVSQLMETARLLRTYVDRRAREHGTTRALWLVLLRLNEEDGVAQVELADRLELKPISLVPLLDRLVAQGCVERRRSTADRRANRLYLTDAGRAVVARLDGVQDDIADDVLAAADSDVIEATLVLLGQVKQRIKTDTGTIEHSITKTDRAIDSSLVSTEFTDP